MDKIKIIIATHKKYCMPEDPIYLPIQVGAKGKQDLGYTRDDSGNNISEKNPSYCELTGMYWAWKNLSAEYIGLVHYRRYFCVKKKSKNSFDNVLNFSEAETLCDNYDVIVPKKRRYYIETLYSHYAHTHYAEHLDVTRGVISELYPEYVKSYDRVLKQRSGYMFNMMLMRKDLFDDYCQWLFSILFELEKKMKQQESKYSDFQLRFYGRISEIIFNVWLYYQVTDNKIIKTKVKEINCIHMEKINWWNKGTAFLKAKFLGKRYECGF